LRGLYKISSSYDVGVNIPVDEGQSVELTNQLALLTTVLILIATHENGTNTYREDIRKDAMFIRRFEGRNEVEC
jgi:hypothetical protein